MVVSKTIHLANQHKKSAIWFLIIGALAALTHYVVAVGLEWLLKINPLYSNIAGFLLAFPVSYVGHYQFTFAAIKTRHQHSLPKFLSIAVLGFLANQGLVALGLIYTDLPFWLLLGVVMVLIAVMTYLLSRYWAFDVEAPD